MHQDKNEHLLDDLLSFIMYIEENTMAFKKKKLKYTFFVVQTGSTILWHKFDSYDGLFYCLLG